MSLHNDVMRSVKQIYTHLGLRDQIPHGNEPVSKLPGAVRKMQTLWQTDPPELKKVVIGFLTWNPPAGKKKSLSQFVERLDDAIASFCFVEDDLGDFDSLEEASVAPQDAKTTQKRPANDDSAEPAQKRHRPQGVTTNSAASSSSSSSSTGTTSTITPSPITPPLSPLSPLPSPNGSEKASDSKNTTENMIYIPARGVKCFKDIHWAVQYEIARFLRTFNIDDPPFELLQRFLEVAKHEPRNLFQTMMQWYTSQPRTTNSNVHLTLMERCSDQVWTHIEKKTADIAATRTIHYRAMIALAPNKEPVIELQPPNVGASNRFFRKYGDHRFLELKLNRSSHVSMIRRNKNYFLKPFLLIGRTFRFLFVKDDTVILFATEGMDLEPISISEVITWHIPILENWDMIISKFASRMSLGYSNSIPTLEFSPDKVEYIDDIFSGEAGDEETCMTDGCGLISVSAMQKIMGCERADALPCAVQGRIGGAKGIWIVAPDLDFNSGDWIKIRASQHKFKTGVLQYSMSVDPLHYTFDLVKNAICLYPSNLNTQFIQCLSAGGVPTSVFVELLTEYLETLTQEVAENRNSRLLRDWAAKSGAIMRARWEAEDTDKDIWQEQTPNETENYDDDTADPTDIAPDQFSAINQKKPDDVLRINRYSGAIGSVHEAAVRMLDSGFDFTNPYLASRITQIFRDMMRSVSIKYRIEVQQSCTTTCIPDPTGILEEGEVFLQLSSRRVDEKTGIHSGLVVGDIVVARNPCGLKSDIQKVKAVDRPELRIYTDVIVFPIKGKRSLASMLAGGDYDGDLVFCCWDQRIVQPFQSSEMQEVPLAMKTAFVKNVSKVRQELLKHRDESAREQAIQTQFISVSLPDGTLGQYENWRTVLAEERSLDDPDVIYLAYMCAKLVDAPKQGLALKQTVLRRDRATFSAVPHPAWFLDKQNKQRQYVFKAYEETNKDAVPSNRPMRTAMDHLHKLLCDKTEAFATFTDRVIDDSEVKFKDPDLAAPWEDAVQMAKELGDKELEADLELIHKEISILCDNYNRDVKDVVFRTQRRNDSRYDPSRETEPFMTERIYSTFFELEEHVAREFLTIPSSITSSFLKIDQKLNHGHMLQKIVASAAYIRSIHLHKYSKFCYVVAFDCLRRIKADAVAGKTKTNAHSESIVPYMYNAMSMTRSWIRKIRDAKSAVDAGTAIDSK